MKIKTTQSIILTEEEENLFNRFEGLIEEIHFETTDSYINETCQNLLCYLNELASCVEDED